MDELPAVCHRSPLSVMNLPLAPSLPREKHFSHHCQYRQAVATMMDAMFGEDHKTMQGASVTDMYT